MRDIFPIVLFGLACCSSLVHAGPLASSGIATGHDLQRRQSGSLGAGDEQGLDSGESTSSNEQTDSEDDSMEHGSIDDVTEASQCPGLFEGNYTSDPGAQSTLWHGQLSFASTSWPTYYEKDTKTHPLMKQFMPIASAAFKCNPEYIARRIFGATDSQLLRTESGKYEDAVGAPGKDFLANSTIVDVNFHGLHANMTFSSANIIVFPGAAQESIVTGVAIQGRPWPSYIDSVFHRSERLACIWNANRGEAKSYEEVEQGSLEDKQIFVYYMITGHEAVALTNEDYNDDLDRLEEDLRLADGQPILYNHKDGFSMAISTYDDETKKYTLGVFEPENLQAAGWPWKVYDAEEMKENMVSIIKAKDNSKAAII